jgi:endonuclease/exonuclease/phosphatase family metal-dependent hydrolase
VLASMRPIVSICASLALMAAALSPAAYAESAVPPEKTAPPGQISVVTTNARQGDTLGPREFKRLLKLTEDLTARPIAFDGGARSRSLAPDVIVMQEMRPSNLEIFENLLNQSSRFQYQMVGPENRAVGIVINTDTVEQVGEVTMFNDVCVGPLTPLDGGRTSRQYPMARFTERATGTPFLVMGVHIPRQKSYSPEQEDCLRRNILAMRSVLAVEAIPVILTGDFNKPAMITQRECDPDERSAPLPWYEAMTEPMGRPYLDAVRTIHRAANTSMVREWTFRRTGTHPLCDGSEGIRSGRIDYLFAAGAVVAAGHADQMRWAQTRLYSDHRFVWSRLVLSGPPAPEPPKLLARSGGEIELTWTPGENIGKWVLYRAKGARPYKKLTTLPGESTSFADGSTEHGVTYRYALAARNPIDGGQGLESRPRRATADARGPRVVRVTPKPGATGVGIRTRISVHFDERIAPFKPKAGLIRLFLGDRSISGEIVRINGRTVEFTPDWPLRKGRRYRVVARGQKDMVGNVGSRFSWRFTTVESMKKKSRH